jgi:hypothetical protein
MRQALFLLLTVSVFCLTVCKVEPDLPADPHVPLVNPFIGVWKDDGMSAQYWQFRTDGTGGKANTQSGPFSNDFSFFYFDGKGTYQRASPSLLILEDSDGGVNVTRYAFEIDGNQAMLIEAPEWENIITLERINVSPQVLNVTNPLIGEWSAEWSLPGYIHDPYPTWSLKYYADGTVKVFHHGVDSTGGHQFENGYALRGNTLVIFGTLRFMNPIIAEINQLENGKWFVQETQEYPGQATWTYTKVNAAKWK